MKVYLAHNGSNYASPNDGYVMGMRTADYVLALYSFYFINGKQTLPIPQSVKAEDKPCAST